MKLPHPGHHTVEWKRADWGTEYRYILRENTAKQFWTEEEDALLWEMYPRTDTLTMLKQFPTSNYDMIAHEQ